MNVKDSEKNARHPKDAARFLFSLIHFTSK